MKLSVSAYRAHASAHKKILDTAYQLNYGSTSASHHATTSSSSTTAATALPVACSPFQVFDNNEYTFIPLQFFLFFY